MATRQIGLGTLVKVDDDDSGAGFTTVGEIVNVTPNGRTRELVDRTVLADTLATMAAGIEAHSEFSFMQFWHPGDTNHQLIDTLFGSKAEVLWQIIYPFSTPVTDQFDGFVSGYEPEEIGRDGIISRRVTVQRTGAITRS